MDFAKAIKSSKIAIPKVTLVLEKNKTYTHVHVRGHHERTSSDVNKLLPIQLQDHSLSQFSNTNNDEKMENDNTNKVRFPMSPNKHSRNNSTTPSFLLKKTVERKKEKELGFLKNNADMKDFMQTDHKFVAHKAPYQKLSEDTSASSQKCTDKNCKNLILVKKYEAIIKELTSENQKLKKINEFFLISMSRKDDYIISLTKETGNNIVANKEQNNNVVNKSIIDNIHRNSSMGNTLSLLENQKRNSETSFIKVLEQAIQKTVSEAVPNTNFMKLDNLKQKMKIRLSKALLPIKPRISLSDDVKIPSEKESPQNGSLSPIRRLSVSKIPSGFGQSTSTNYFRNLKKSNEPKSHYDQILDMFNKKSHKDRARDTRASFLALPDEILGKILQHDINKEILKLTNNDEEFVQAIRNFPEDKLLMFSDSISTLIKDYEYTINLIKRMKRFLQINVRVVNTLILEDAISMLIKNSCEILECERTTIYVHDKFLNVLIMHVGQELQKGDWKMSTDRGIVGYVFMNGEKQKIDDVYLDERFDRENDKKIGFKTKSMLCVPLKDEEGKCFGVIQALNKKGGVIFSIDDEELMDVFATQATTILKNSMKYDENLSFNSRLKMILNFSLKIQSCSSVGEYTLMGEQLLMSFWGTNRAQILIYDQSEERLLHYTDDENYQVKPVNMGLVGKALSKMEIICVNSVYDNSDFNSLVDIECGFALITFPVLKISSNLPVREVLAVCQVGYTFKMNNANMKLKENDEVVINSFSSVSSLWLCRHAMVNTAEMS